MIVYNSRSQWRIVFFRSGSALSNTMRENAFAGGLAFLWSVNRKYNMIENVGTTNAVKHPLVVQVFAFLLGFLLVSRCTNSMERYFSGATSVYTMLSKWLDAYSVLIALLEVTVSRTDERDRAQRAEILALLKMRATHYFTMLSAFALASLGTEMTGSDTLTGITPDEVHVRQMSRHNGVMVMNGSATKNMLTEPLMRGFVARKTTKAIQEPFEVVGQFTHQERQDLLATDNPVTLISSWIIEEFTMAIQLGHINIPPPILSRLYQELSTGVQAYKDAWLIAFVPYPFCFAQLISLLMMMLILTAPIFITYMTANMAIAPICSSICIFGYYGLNSVATELEQPFGDDDNDLPLRDLQLQFIEHIESCGKPNDANIADMNAAPIKRFERVKTHSGISSIGWDKVEDINAEIKEEFLRDTIFDLWMTKEEVLQLSVPQLTRKFRDVDVARHVRRRLRVHARPPVTEDEVNQCFAENLQLVEEIERSEEKRVKLREELGPRRAMLKHESSKRDKKGGPGDTSDDNGAHGLRLARLRAARRENDEFRAGIRLEKARAGGPPKILEEVDNLKYETKQLDALLLATSTNAEEEERREIIKKELGNLAEDLHHLQESKKRLIQRCEQEMDEADKRLLEELQEIRGPDSNIGSDDEFPPDFADDMVLSMYNTETSLPFVPEGEREEGDEGNMVDEETGFRPDTLAVRPHTVPATREASSLRLKLWSELSHKKLSDIVAFVSGEMSGKRKESVRNRHGSIQRLDSGLSAGRRTSAGSMSHTPDPMGSPMSSASFNNSRGMLGSPAYSVEGDDGLCVEEWV